MLSLDLGLDDCLYRQSQQGHICHVTVTDISVISEDRRTYGPSVLAELRQLEDWTGTWDTLTIIKEFNRVRCIHDNGIVEGDMLVRDLSQLSKMSDKQVETFYSSLSDILLELRNYPFERIGSIALRDH